MQDQVELSTEPVRRGNGISPEPADVQTARRQMGRTGLIRSALRESGRISGLYLLVVVILTFSLVRPHTFATATNLRVILAGQAVVALLALATLLPLSAGQLDISMAGNMGLCVIVTGWLQYHGAGVATTVIATLGVGLAIGIANSLAVIVFRVSALIATLGMASILGALAVAVSNGRGFSTGMSSALKTFGQTKLFSLPLPFYYMLIIAGILYYVMEWTVLGRYIRAIGANRDAARLTGIRVELVTATCFITSALIASFAGLMYAAQLGTSPLGAGDPYLLSSFAAAFLGATQFKRNQFNIPGTLLAIYVLATLVNGLQILYPSNSWLTQLFQGAALIVAVALAVGHRKSVLKPDRSRGLAS